MSDPELKTSTLTEMTHQRHHRPEVKINYPPAGKVLDYTRLYSCYKYVLERTDPRTGRTYYVDHNTHRTTWEKPRSASTAPPPPASTEATPNPAAPAALTVTENNSGNNFLPGNIYESQ